MHRPPSSLLPLSFNLFWLPKSSRLPTQHSKMNSLFSIQSSVFIHSHLSTQLILLQLAENTPDAELIGFPTFVLTNLFWPLTSRTRGRNQHRQTNSLYSAYSWTNDLLRNAIGDGQMEEKRGFVAIRKNYVGGRITYSSNFGLKRVHIWLPNLYTGPEWLLIHHKNTFELLHWGQGCLLLQFAKFP